MVYVYCKRGSDSARALSEAVEGKRLRMFDGMSFFRAGKRVKFQPGDCIIAWGEPVPDLPNLRVLNGATLPNKYKTVFILQEHSIPTIEAYHKCPKDADGRPRKDFIGRSFTHVGGNDLLNPLPTPDFWVRKLNIVEEYRIHSFLGKSIRAGKKILREGFSTDADAVKASNGTLQLASSWIRSFDGGWRICYDNFQSKKDMRELAHKAVEALGLQFGAVDIGLLANGKLLVLEVNRAPGLEGGSISQYAQHVKDWVNNAGNRNEAGNNQVGEPVQSQEPVASQLGGAPEAVAGSESSASAAAGNSSAAVPNPSSGPVTPVAAGTPSFGNWTIQYNSDPPAPLAAGRSASSAGTVRYASIPAARSQEPRQSVPEAGPTDGANEIISRAYRSAFAANVQRRRITWSQWRNKYDRLTSPEARAQATNEATAEARQGKLPFEPISG